MAFERGKEWFQGVVSTHPATIRWGTQLRFTLLLCLLPVFAASSALIHSQINNSTPIIILIIICSLSPFVLFRLNSRFHAIGLYAVSLALLLQNTFVHRNLAGGDAETEYYIAAMTLGRGWDPSAEMAHNNLIRLVFEHPMTAQILGVDLRWSFKLVHPLFLAILPVGIYLLAREIFDERVALGSAFFYIVLHPFFTRLSRDTRSGIAVMLFVLFFFTLWKSYSTTAYQKSRKFSVLAFILTLGIIGSHEGVSAIALGIGILFVIISFLITGRNRGVLVVLIFGSVLYLWYTSFSGGEFFDLLVSVVYNLVAGILSGSGNSEAASAATQQTISFTYTFIKIEFIVLYGMAGLGYLTAWYHWYQDHSPPIEYLFLTGAPFVILAAAFGPVNIMGIQRTSAIVGSLIFPLAAYFFLSNTRISADHLSVGIVLLLLVNAGVVGWAMHERTPQPNLQRATIDQEPGINYWHLRTRWTTDAEIVGSNWAYDNVPSDDEIYTSSGGGKIKTFTATRTKQYLQRQPGNFRGVPCNVTESGHPLYYNKYATDTGKFPISRGSASFSDAIFANTSMEMRTIIYSNGDTAVGLTQHNESFC